MHHTTTTGPRRDDVVARSWREAYDRSPTGVALVAADGTLLRVNDALCQLLDRDRATLLAGGFQALTHPDDLAVDQGLLGQVLEGRREGYRLTQRYLRPDGSVVWADLAVTAVRAPDGTLAHLVSQVSDVTDQHVGRRRLAGLAAGLSDRARRLEQSNADLHAFAAAVSHDLQSPLTALRGYLTLLRDPAGGWSPEQHDLMLGRAAAAADQMNDLIGSLLEFATIDTSPVTGPVPLRGVVEGAVTALADASAVTGAEVHVVSTDPDDADDAVVVGAAPLLQTLVVNLVGNALKHGRGDGPTRVRVSTGHAAGSDGHPLAEIVVSDNGPGVPDDELARVTTMFARGADTVTHGYGIGLSTCRRIVSGHGGRLELGRAPEGGLLVRCVFPASRGSAG